MPVQTTVQMRRDTAANWTSTNPTLASGEWGLETDTRLMKIGDGSTAWNSLAYQLGPMLDEVIATDPTGAYFDGTGFRAYQTSGNFASAPDSAALDITGDIDLRAKASLTSWTAPSTTVNFLAKLTTTGNQRSYDFSITSTGLLRIRWSADGLVLNSVTSTSAVTFSANTTNWVRVTLDVNNGASGRDITFYTSADGTTWTQLGNVVTEAGTTSIFSGSSLLYLGASAQGTEAFLTGYLYRAQILNGIGGTTAFDANFESVAADSFAFTESSANAATVTLTTTRYSFGIPSATLTGTTTVSYGANTTFYMPFAVANKPLTIKHMAFEQTTTVSGTTRLAIYKADANMQPTGAPLFNSGAISVAAAAAIYRVRVAPFTLYRGNYLLAYNSTGTQTVRIWTGGNGAFAPNTMGANLNVSFSVAQTLSGDFPNTPVNWTTRNAANAAARYATLLGWS